MSVTVKCIALLIASITLLGHVCFPQCSPPATCIAPTTETSAWAGVAYTTTGYFLQTLGDSFGTSFNAFTVSEDQGATGGNGCYFTGADVNRDPPAPTVAFSSWTVNGFIELGFGNTGGLAGWNRWGFDDVGFVKGSVDYIRSFASATPPELPLVTLPCGMVIYQNLKIDSCDDYSTIGYEANNVLSATIYSDHIVVCRKSTLEGISHCQTINY